MPAKTECFAIADQDLEKLDALVGLESTFPHLAAQLHGCDELWTNDNRLVGAFRGLAVVVTG